MELVRDVLEHKGYDVFSVHPESTVLEALKVLEARNIGALLVVDKHANLKGIFSERDYARKIILQGKASADTHVKDVMTTQVFCVSSGQTIESCMALMTQKRVRHLPVVDDDKLVGLISIGDVVKALLHEKDLLIEQLEHYIMGSV
jgi:CBS domain-containing protein